MSPVIEYRSYQKEDFPYLCQIVRRAWDYDDRFSRKTAAVLARLDIYGCLNAATFTKIALIHGKPVGFIFGTSDLKKTDPYYENKTKEMQKALNHRPEALICNAIYGIQDLINKRLMKKSGRRYEGELIFFAIRKECRGHGIGKELYERFVGDLRKNHVKNFFVKTDTASNFGFYDHEGLVRRSTIPLKIPVCGKKHWDLYLYDNCIR